MGIGLAALGVGGALAQTSVDGLDLESIDKRAKASAADLSQFVDQVLGAQEQAAETGLSRDIRRRTVEEKAEERRRLAKEVPF